MRRYFLKCGSIHRCDMLRSRRGCKILRTFDFGGPFLIFTSKQRSERIVSSRECEKLGMRGVSRSLCSTLRTRVQRQRPPRCTYLARKHNLYAMLLVSGTERAFTHHKGGTNSSFVSNIFHRSARFFFGSKCCGCGVWSYIIYFRLSNLLLLLVKRLPCSLHNCMWYKHANI